MDSKNQRQPGKEEINDEGSEGGSGREGLRQKREEGKSRQIHSRLKQRKRQRTRIKSEYWDYQQIHKIFTLYAEYGSQWKCMETQFEDRSANSIKNRFYTVIRTFLKLLFRYHPSIIEKLPHEIPSKTILKFYESREEFAKFADFGKRTMKRINYNIDSHQLKKLVDQHVQQILQIYNLIFNLGPRVQKEQPSGKKDVKKSMSEDNQPLSRSKSSEEVANSARIQPRSIPVQLFKSKNQGQPNIQNQSQLYPVQGSYPMPGPMPAFFLFFPVVGIYSEAPQQPSPP